MLEKKRDKFIRLAKAVRLMSHGAPHKVARKKYQVDYDALTRAYDVYLSMQIKSPNQIMFVKIVKTVKIKSKYDPK